VDVMSSRCPCCGIEDDMDPAAAGFPPFTEGDVLVCEGCGLVEIATGVLWEARPPTPTDLARIQPFLDEIRRTHAMWS
jgi:hypothetical protein